MACSNDNSGSVGDKNAIRHLERVDKDGNGRLQDGDRVVFKIKAGGQSVDIESQDFRRSTFRTWDGP